MTKPSFPGWERRFLILASPAVILLFLAVLLLSMQQRSASTARVQRTYDVIALLRQVRTRLIDAETGQRGFIITGDSAYLAPHRTAAAETHVALDSVQVLLRGDPQQTARLAHLHHLVVSRLAILELPIQRRAESFAAAREQLVAGRGREAMASVRAQLRLLEAAERERLTAELHSQALAGWAVLAAALLGTAVVLAVSLFTRGRFARYEGELEQSNAALMDLNGRLEEQAVELELQTQELQLQTAQLEETTAELLVTNEELEQQRQHLEDMALELETANEELQAASALADERRAEAESANHIKTQFLTSMSHELRTPLNAISGYVDLLEFNVHGPLTEAQRNALHRIKLNGNHLLVLINDILDYAKVQAGRVELRPRDVALPELLAETAELVHPLLQARHITLHTELDRPGLLVRGDPDRIRQILLNLLTNAAKYSNEGGAVTVSAELDGPHVRVRVRDSGWGIPPEQQQAIFDPFVRLNRAAGGSLGDGVGLGLSISRQLAAAMSGDLTVESTPGEGSTFTLSLASSAVLAGEGPAGGQDPAQVPNRADSAILQ